MCEATPALRWLRDHNAVFQTHTVVHEMIGRESLAESFARQLEAPLSHVLKSMVFEDTDDPQQPPFLVVQHGDRKIDTRALAAQAGLGTHKVRLCRAERAAEFTGYRFGGTSPFGLARASDVRVFCEDTVAALDSPRRLWVNGGSWTCVVSLDPSHFLALLNPTLIRCGCGDVGGKQQQ